MNNKFLRFHLLLLFFFSCFLLNAQTEKEKVSLSEILTQIQEKHHYNFTYAHDVIKDVVLIPPPSNLNLEETIVYLEQNTSLTFQVLKNQIITISPPLELDSICGYLIDAETLMPIKNATIISENTHAISDVFGHFRLNNSSKNKTLFIQHLGYMSRSLFLGAFKSELCENIYLSPNIEVFSEVLLKDFIAKGIYKLADGTFNINFSDFGILPGLIETDVLQTVQALPGIQSANETVSDINIRGGTNDQNLVLWDGIKMYQSGHFFGLISIFNPLITTNVSIIKNGSNADLSDGVSGTISMKTESGINDKFKASFGANFINIDAFVDAPLGERSSIQIASRKALSNLVEKPTYSSYYNRILQDSEVENNTTEVINSGIKFDFYDTSFRWLYKLRAKDQIRFNFININNELVFNENAVVNGLENSKESSLQQNSIAASIFYRRHWSDKFSSTFQVFETNYTLKAINADVLKERRVLQENDVAETSFKINNYYNINSELSFLGGYHFTQTIIKNLTDVDNPIVVQSVKEVIREHAAYSQLTYLSKSQKTTLKIGLRYNFIEKFQIHIIEPRISVNQRIFNNFSMEFLAEIKHQNTSQIINFQNDFLGVEKRRWLLSNNQDIPIIKSKQASVGLNYNYKGWLITSEGYYKKIKGITTQSQGFLNQYSLARTNGDYLVKGIDVLLNKKLKKYGFWLSYSYADNVYTFNELQDQPFPNNIDIKHAIALGSSFTAESFEISLGLNWHSGKPTTSSVVGNEIINDQINFQPANQQRLKEYLRIDTSATYRFKLNNKIEAVTGISLWNSLNHDNLIDSYYTIENNTIVKNSNKALEITPNFSFRVHF